MIKLTAFLILIIFNIACFYEKQIQADSTGDTLGKIDKKNTDSHSSDRNHKVETDSSEDVKDSTKTISIKNSIGLIVLSDQYPASDEKKNKSDFIRFYNEDGSLWYEFTFYYDDSDGEFEYKNDTFRAFAFHPDYFLLAVKCIGEDKERYKVVVNEETGLAKYVRKDDINLKIESWESHLLKTFAIDVEKDKNPVFETPDGKELKLDVESIERFEAVEVKGDWLKVKWETGDKKDKFKYGWVRWKNDGILVINWFYFA